MQSQVTTCCICLTEYNLTNKRPKLVPSCGHTFCLSCLDKILKSEATRGNCPLDRIPFQSTYTTTEFFPTNIALLSLIEDQQQAKFETCPLHDDPLNLICLLDGAQVCRYCVDFGTHKSHNVMHVNDIKKEAKEKIERLEKTIQGCETFRRYVSTLVEFSRKDMLAKTRKKFDRFREILTSKENETCQEIEKLFEQEKIKVLSTIDKNSAAVEEMKELLNALRRSETDKAFVMALEAEEKRKFDNIIEQETFKKRMQKVKQRFEKPLEGLNTLLQSTIGEFHPLNFSPIQEAEKVKAEECLKQISAKTETSQKEVTSMRPARAVLKKRIENQSSTEKFKILESIEFKFQENHLIISSKRADRMIEKNGPVQLHADELQKVDQVTINSDGWMFSEEVLPVVAHIWNKLGEVTNLHINFVAKFLTDAGLSALSANPFWATKSIQKFELDIHGGNVSDQSVMKLMGDAMAKMVGMKNLKIQLSETKITDKSVYMLTDIVLPVMSSLKHFALRIAGTQISDSSIEPLCKKVKTVLHSVTSFSLDLTNTKITDKSLEAINSHVLIALTNLETLELGVGEVKLSEAKIGALATVFQMCGKNIKSMVLNFEDTKITDKNMSNLMASFSQMPALKEVKLNLKNTTNLGLTILDHLEQLKSKMKIQVDHDKN